jgi:hypothetical protein
MAGSAHGHFAEDTLDSPNFDPIADINQKFPTESSLNEIDTFVVGIGCKITTLDDEISKAVQAQSRAGEQATKVSPLPSSCAPLMLCCGLGHHGCSVRHQRIVREDRRYQNQSLPVGADGSGDLRRYQEAGLCQESFAEHHHLSQETPDAHHCRGTTGGRWSRVLPLFSFPLTDLSPPLPSSLS